MYNNENGSTEIKKNKTTVRKPVQDQRVELKQVKLFHAIPGSRMTVEEMVAIIYQQYFEYLTNSNIHDVIQVIVKRHLESVEFVKYCVGKMILSGVSFKR